jgi:hypothetical protein
VKKNLTILFSFVLIFGFAGSSSAGYMPYNIGTVTDFLNDTTYFNGYAPITDPTFDFSGVWGYTAVAFESGHINYVSKSPGGTQTFTTASTDNFGVFDYVDFDTHNLYFSDGNPLDVPLEPFVSAGPFFRFFELTNDSNPLSYLTPGPSGPVFSAGTVFIGFNDNGSPPVGDSDFDDIIVAAQRVSEPATMLFLGIGLIGLAGLGRKKFKKK